MIPRRGVSAAHCLQGHQGDDGSNGETNLASFGI